MSKKLRRILNGNLSYSSEIEDFIENEISSLLSKRKLLNTPEKKQTKKSKEDYDDDVENEDIDYYEEEILPFEEKENYKEEYRNKNIKRLIKDTLKPTINEWLEENIENIIDKVLEEKIDGNGRSSSKKTKPKNFFNINRKRDREDY